MTDYPKVCWSDEDKGKLRSARMSRGKGSVPCPAPNCSGTVSIKPETGEKYFKKKYVSNTYGLRFSCNRCERSDVSTYTRR